MKGRRPVLDVGCGAGAKHPLLRKRGLYLGIDADIQPLGTLRRLYPAARVVLSSVPPIALGEGSVDEVHLYDVLEHVEDPRGVIAEVARVTRPGGRMVIESPFWRSEEFVAALLPTYAEEVGHRVVLHEADVRELAKPFCTLVRISRKHGMQNLLMAYYAWRGGHITGQSGRFSNGNRFLDTLVALCSEDLFFLRILGRIPLWIFVPVWVFTLPVGWLVSRLFPKTIRYEFRRTGA